MMKRILSVLCCAFLFFPLTALAHKPLLMVDDNGDGTIYIETGFSDGSSGAGHTIRLTDAASGKVLAEAKVPAAGSLDMKKPEVPYLVVFDAGEGHVTEAQGPAPSETGPGKPAAGKQTGTAEPAAPAPETATAPETAPAPQPVALPAAVGSGYGASTAYQMMMVTQVFTAVGVFLVFGAIMFFVGQRFERNKASR